jgi:CDP-diacylglycerol--glycerol-3-phosphate 3-phosphatidyltransferase/CDP-diacylglycerol--inositol 3-phosphatidyltransferase
VSDGLEQRTPRERERPPRGNGRAGMTAAEMRAVARNRLIESRLTPNAISLTGFVGNLIAAGLILHHDFVLAGVAFILGSLCDMFDGRYSRMSGKGTPFGAFLDSTLDRIGDAAVFGGIALYFAWVAEDRLYLALSLVVLAMGAVTSYARAKADHLGFDAKVGVAERPDRLVGFLVPAFFADVLDLPVLLHISLWLLAVASTVTVVQRIWVVRRQALAAVAPAPETPPGPLTG